MLTLVFVGAVSQTATATEKNTNPPFEVSGKVTGNNGETLVGVTVAEKGVGNGVATDVNGNFKLKVSNGNAILLVRYIGYKTKEVPVNNNATLNIRLSSDSQSLNEVVVVAYGSQKKGDITGAVTTIKASDVKDQPVTQFTQSIQGKTPGVQINQTTGVPGQGMQIRIRGAASFGTNSQPLYVVDGVPLVSDINNLNPEEIETFTILKDASSTALYGSRAANGVVIITTKHAKVGQSSLTFNSFYGVQSVPQKGRPDMMNAEEFAQYEQDVFTEKIILGQATSIPVEYQNPSQYAGKGTDWYNVLLRNAPIQSYNLALSSGTEKSTTSATLGFLDQDGVLIASNYKRYSVRVNSEYKFNSKITVGLNVAPTYEKLANGNSDGNIFGGGIIQNAITSSPISPYKNPDGSLPLTSQSPGLFGNPNWYRVATEATNNTQKGRLLSNAYANIEIIKDLNFRTSLNIDYVNEQNQQWNPSTTGGLFAPPPIVANASTYSNIYYSWLAENTLNYKHNFGDHNFDVLVGYTAQKYHQNYNQESGYGFPNDNISSLAAATQFNNPQYDIQEWSLASFVSRLNYNYKNRYLISASYRRDGSSRFAPNTKYGNFPAVSVGWNAPEEPFMKKISVISDLKLRAGYGVNGNFAIKNYGFIPNTQTSNYTFNGTLTPGTSIANIGNNNLSWEKARQLDIGADFSILNGRISVSYDYFHKITSSLLYQINVPQESGFSNISDNVAKIRFQGHEFSINSQNLIGDFRWSTNFNISFVRSKILNLGPYGSYLPRNTNGSNIEMIGQPLGMFYGYKFIGIYKNQQDFDSSAKYLGSDSPSAVGTVKYADINGDGVIDLKDQTFIGNPNPDFTYGMTNNLYFKNFDFGVTVSGAYGGDLQNRTLEYIQNLDGVFNVTKDVANRWKSPTDPGDGVHPRIVVGTALARYTNSRWVSDGSYLTVKNVTLGYTIPLNKSNNYFKSIRVYTSAQQLFVFTKYKGANPEVSGLEGSSPLNIGIDNTSYPVPRTISFGVNVNLK
ncbi:SusC/RagA family TonB-linked outer membrane protein [Mucilaginibacter sp. SP1R1]|uniref:SusC/RagA family TonB-linked outer membrane protein n=1 Tax=Mucilaginibacter sp. SP1R1 TaxID=2723091 RepID=UPI00160C6CA9|nr:TonB-dependent receptor [Mucilaginibacter sp. SP1R1]MBB6148123.1 TonB-linked SusC/RagA family outer membrane protein [Mucilaginibacter sp. SP1R1]